MRRYDPAWPVATVWHHTVAHCHQPLPQTTTFLHIGIFKGKALKPAEHPSRMRRYDPAVLVATVWQHTAAHCHQPLPRTTALHP
ncbi:hypothetical protein JCM16814_12820 [Desulfobaculum senezii]